VIGWRQPGAAGDRGRGLPPALQPEERRVVGLEGDDPDRHHRRAVDALDLEGFDHSRQDQGSFGQCELGADADQRTDPERRCRCSTQGAMNTIARAGIGMPPALSAFRACRTMVNAGG